MSATSTLDKLVSMTGPLDTLRVWASQGRDRAREEWRITQVARRRGLPRRTIDQIFPIHDTPIRFTASGAYASVNVHEMAVLATAAATSNAKKIVEIGTFRGATAYVLAQNAPDATVYTLDLPPETKAGVLPVVATDRGVTACRGEQMAFDGTPEASRITCLFGDSAIFDFDAVGGDIDLAFIDGAHSYEYVKNDTEKILPRMRPGGVVLWHDYSDAFPGIVRYLNDIGRRGLISVMATTVVAYRIPNE